MKRIFVLCSILLLLLSCLCGCVRNSSDSLSRFEFREIPWNASVQETIEMIGVSAESVTYGEPYSSEGFSGQNIVIEGYDAFGCTAKYAIFCFEGYLGAEPGLAMIKFFYEDGTDPALLKSSITELYGESTDSFKEYTGYDGEDHWREVNSSDICTYWYSDVVLNNILSKREKNAVLEYFSQEAKQPYPEDSVQLYMNQPVANIVLNTQYAHPEWYAEIVVGINGGNALFFEQLANP